VFLNLRVVGGAILNTGLLGKLKKQAENRGNQSEKVTVGAASKSWRVRGFVPVATGGKHKPVAALEDLTQSTYDWSQPWAKKLALRPPGFAIPRGRNSSRWVTSLQAGET